MKSKPVPSTGYYDISFCSSEIQLSSITEQEAMTRIAQYNWAFMYGGWYIEGSNYSDWVVKDDSYHGNVPLTSGLPYGGITIDEAQGFNFSNIKLPDLTIPGAITYIGTPPESLYNTNTAPTPKEFKSQHECKDFKMYQGLVESYEYCTVCDKKRS